MSSESDSQRTVDRVPAAAPAESDPIAVPEGPIESLKATAKAKLNEKKGDILKSWKQFGGGAYGAGAVVTFAVLTVRDFVDSLREFDGIADYLVNRLVPDLGLSALGNTIEAALWPFILLDFFSK